MYILTFITLITTLIAITTATPASIRSLTARTIPSVDLLVRSSLLNAPNVNEHAIQVVLGEAKICLGDNGFSPCMLSKVSISPFGNTTDIAKVECQGFSDTKAQVPVTYVFDSQNPVVLSSVGTVEFGSFIYEFVQMKRGLGCRFWDRDEIGVGV